MLRRVISARQGSPAMKAAIPARAVSSKLSIGDRLAAARLRLGIGRNKAAIGPGLYFAGKPDPNSPVLVTANYRLSFDALRKELSGVNAWIMAIDTKGVNVWCAAGKGTFCAGEIARRARLCGLDAAAPKAPLILPQLSASGVDANELRRATGRKVLFGPVRARDIKPYLEAGMRKTAGMSTVDFTLADRAVLIPIELVHARPLFLASLIVPLALALPFDPLYGARYGAYAAYLAASLAAGAAGVPLLLPWLPGRFFSVRSLAPFAATTAAAALYAFSSPGAMGNPRLSETFHAVPTTAAVLLSGAAAAYIAMNFTGSSTFTNQKGAELEVRRTLPFIAGAVISGCVLSIGWLIAAAIGCIGGTL